MQISSLSISIIPHLVVDVNYVDTFLLTFRHFMKPPAFFIAINEKFKSLSAEHQNQSKNGEEEVKKYVIEMSR